MDFRIRWHHFEHTPTKWISASVGTISNIPLQNGFPHPLAPFRTYPYKMDFRIRWHHFEHTPTKWISASVGTISNIPLQNGFPHPLAPFRTYPYKMDFRIRWHPALHPALLTTSSLCWNCFQRKQMRLCVCASVDLLMSAVVHLGQGTWGPSAR